MPTDRIIQPEEIAAIIRGFLAGDLDGTDAALRAMRLAGSMDRILAGHRTLAVTEAYWALRRLAETGAGRPDRETMTALLDIVEGRRRIPQEWQERPAPLRFADDSAAEARRLSRG